MSTSNVPPGTKHARRVTPQIRTSRNLSTKLIEAKFTDVREYEDPNEAPVFTRMTAPSPRRNSTGTWTGEIIIQVYAVTESDALKTLLRQLDELGLYTGDMYEVEIVANELARADDNTPWEQRPLDAHGHKTRRHRTAWTDPATGKQVHIYPETGKRHADPNCPCAHCSIPTPKKTTKKTTKK